MKLRCYCCGKPIVGLFAIVTLGADNVDRVFVFDHEHTDRAEDAKSMLVVPAERS